MAVHRVSPQLKKPTRFRILYKIYRAYLYQMSCTRDDFSAKISLKEHFWPELIGVWKIALLSKDPVELRVRLELRVKQWQQAKYSTFCMLWFEKHYSVCFMTNKWWWWEVNFKFPPFKIKTSNNNSHQHQTEGSKKKWK